MDNLFVLMCVGALILIMLFAFFSMMRGRRGNAAGPYATRGNEIPRYDDPNVSSGGSFGGQPRSSGLGTSAPSATRGTTLGESRPSHNDPNIKSGGSFGG